MIMGNRLIISRLKNYVVSAHFSEKELVHIQVDRPLEDTLLGNIYLARVKNIVTNINAAFVEIEDGKMCFLSLAECTAPVMSNGKFSGKIKVDDELIVQVVKEGTKLKAPMVTTSFSLTGKYVVLQHGKPVLGISSKITDKEERKRLKNIVLPFISEDYGYILRTNAVKQSEEVIEDELHRLYELYSRLINFGIHFSCFSLLYQTPPSYIWDVRDDYAGELEKIVTDDKEIYDRIYNYLSENQREDLPKLTLYNDESFPLRMMYNLEARLENLLKDKVWLSSGAFLVIEPTEAMTVIDVNTGKAIAGKKPVEATFFKVNLEAAEEIAKQIRLRNLSGIIIVDFIDMQEEEHKKELMKSLDAFLSEDRIKTNLVDMTALNLVEITRKKVRKPLHEQIRLEEE